MNSPSGAAAFQLFFFFWLVENQLPASFYAPPSRKQAWAKSAVETNLIFDFLAAARQIETSHKSRQETPVADAQRACCFWLYFHFYFYKFPLAVFKLPFYKFIFIFCPQLVKTFR